MRTIKSILFTVALLTLFTSAASARNLFPPRNPGHGGGGSHQVPELDPKSSAGALTLLAGAALLVIEGRRRRRSGR